MNWKTREFEFLRREWLFLHEQERRMEMRGIIAEVFRNFETARAFTRTVPLAIPGSNGSTGYVQHATTTEVTNERHKPEGSP